jgi:hypothetical protein
MSTDYTVFIGAYIKILKPLVGTISKTSSECPKCRSKRSGKFCAECGAEIKINNTISIKTLESTSEILNHILSLDPELDSDEIYDTFMIIEFYDNVFIPNYRSDYNKSFDPKQDCESFDLDELMINKEDAIDELKENGKVLLELLDKYNVEYKIVYGITNFSY